VRARAPRPCPLLLLFSASCNFDSTPACGAEKSTSPAMTFYNRALAHPRMHAVLKRQPSVARTTFWRNELPLLCMKRLLASSPHRRGMSGRIQQDCKSRSLHYSNAGAASSSKVSTERRIRLPFFWPTWIPWPAHASLMVDRARPPFPMRAESREDISRPFSPLGRVQRDAARKRRCTIETSVSVCVGGVRAQRRTILVYWPGPGERIDDGRMRANRKHLPAVFSRPFCRGIYRILNGNEVLRSLFIRTVFTASVTISPP